MVVRVNGGAGGQSVAIPFRAPKNPNVYGNAGVLDYLNNDQYIQHGWCLGDSRTEGIISTMFMGKAPSGVKVGGIVPVQGSNATSGWDSSEQGRPGGGDSITTSPYLGVAANPITKREFRTRAETTQNNNALSNRITYGTLPTGATTLFARLNARPSRLRCLIRRSNQAFSGALTWPNEPQTYSAVYLQWRADAETEYGDPNNLRSNPLPLYHTDGVDYTCAGLTVPAGRNWQTLNPDIGYICEPGKTQASAGKIACVSDIWVELPTGIILRDIGCVAGRSIYALLSDETLPIGTFTDAAATIGGQHFLWLAIGTNNIGNMTPAQFASALTTVTEKFRAAFPTGPVVLTTSYPAQSDGSTEPNYVQGIRNFVAQDKYAVALDTYKALPTYTAGAGLGYYGDGTHYNATGQAAYAAKHWDLWLTA